MAILTDSTTPLGHLFILNSAQLKSGNPEPLLPPFVVGFLEEADPKLLDLLIGWGGWGFRQSETRDLTDEDFQGSK